MRRTIALLALGLGVFPVGAAFAQNTPPRNLILFVPDGMRALKVTPETTPAMAALREGGVNFRNSHSLYPTFTMTNASGLATGHHPGDSGVFANSLYTAQPTHEQDDSPVPFIENDQVLCQLDDLHNGDFLNEETILKAARDAGFSTAAIGKLGPTFLFDHTERSGTKTIIFDDHTGTSHSDGRPRGIPLSEDMKTALTQAGLPVATPDRGPNLPNTAQQAYFADVATKVLLPMFKARNKPFVLVFWSRDPDASQHGTRDSIDLIEPGINGPTALAGMKNADDSLAALRRALDDLGLAATTNIVVSSDHGFSTISKESATSPSTKGAYPNTPAGFLPLGFVALDLAKTLDLPMFDPGNKNAKIGENQYPKFGNALLGPDPAKPEVVVATNGGSDLIYVPGKDRALVQKIIDALMAQDYTSGLFVDDELGKFAGTLPLSAINLYGASVTMRPAIVVNFRSYAKGCDQPAACSVVVADTMLRQGMGMHGSFSRGETFNFTAAIGPDFKAGYVSDLPVSNADVGFTLAHLLGLKPKANGKLIGRVMTEAFPNGAIASAEKTTLESEPAANGLRTVLKLQRVGQHRYFDVAGFPGRTVGLE